MIQHHRFQWTKECCHGEADGQGLGRALGDDTSAMSDAITVMSDNISVMSDGAAAFHQADWQGLESHPGGDGEADRSGLKGYTGRLSRKTFTRLKMAFWEAMESWINRAQRGILGE